MSEVPNFKLLVSINSAARNNENSTTIKDNPLYVYSRYNGYIHFIILSTIRVVTVMAANTFSSTSADDEVI